MVHFGARDYDPEIGRWTTTDPFLFLSGSTNLYAYAKNDPVNKYDASGLGKPDCDKDNDRGCDGQPSSGDSDDGQERPGWRDSVVPFSIPYWADGVMDWVGAIVGLLGNLSSSAAPALSSASSAVGLATWPVAFENARQTGDRVAEVLINQVQERRMKILDDIEDEISGNPRRRDCP